MLEPTHASRCRCTATACIFSSHLSAELHHVYPGQARGACRQPPRQEASRWAITRRFGCGRMSRCHAKMVGLESPFLESFFRYQLFNMGYERDIVTRCEADQAQAEGLPPHLRPLRHHLEEAQREHRCRRESTIASAGRHHTPHRCRGTVPPHLRPCEVPFEWSARVQHATSHH